MNMAEYLRIWIDTYIAPNRAPSTVKGYREALAHLSPAVLGCTLDQIDPLMLQREINSLAAIYPRQAQILHVALHEALKRAVMIHRIRENPMNVVEKPKHEPREAETLTAPETAAYLRAARDMPAGRLLILMTLLGLRRNEARGLYPDDLDADGILHIRRQRTRHGVGPLKSKSSRRNIPLSEPMRSIFAGTPGQYLVDVSEKSLTTQHRKALSAAGIDKHVTLHGLRHTCATLAIANGCALVDVQHLLGHKHFQLTADLYTHAQAAMLARCTDVVFGSIFDHHTEMGARLEIV
jgi:Site-specific recombinase XerD